MSAESNGMTTKIKPYLILDAFRGFACLWVVAYHMAEVLINRYPQLGANPLYRASFHGDAGVQLFFVISGYCIASAMSAALSRENSFSYFTKARVRRIYPTAALAIVCGFLYSTIATMFLSHGLIGSSTAAGKNVWSHGPLYFLANFTLTNIVFHQGFVLGPAWTLCYEVAFYLIVGAFILALHPRLPERAILNGIHALTGLVLAVLIADPGVVPYPLDLWPEFGMGVVVYDLVKNRGGRATLLWTAALSVEVIAFLALHNTPLGVMLTPSRQQYAISFGFAALLVALYRYDAAVIRLPPMRVLAVVGTFSYSLYLTHTFSIGIITQVIKRFHWPFEYHYLSFFLAALGAVAFGRLFYMVCERPFTSSKLKGIHAGARHPEKEPDLIPEPVAPKEPAAASVVD